MASGQAHARISAWLCFATWAITCLIRWDFKASGLVIVAYFAAIIGKAPDTDHDMHLVTKIFGGHRSAYTHSIIQISFILVPIAIAGTIAKPMVEGLHAAITFIYNFAISVPAYCGIATASHLVADGFVGKWRNKYTEVFAWISATVLLVVCFWLLLEVII